MKYINLIESIRNTAKEHEATHVVLYKIGTVLGSIHKQGNERIKRQKFYDINENIWEKLIKKTRAEKEGNEYYRSTYQGINKAYIDGEAEEIIRCYRELKLIHKQDINTALKELYKQSTRGKIETIESTIKQIGRTTIWDDKHLDIVLNRLKRMLYYVSEEEIELYMREIKRRI